MYKFFFTVLFLYCTNLFSFQHKVQVAIIGSGPAGLTAAIYTSRAELSTLVLEGNEPGGQIAMTSMVENFPGFPHGVDGYELAMNMREQAKKFGAHIKTEKIARVDLSNRPFSLILESGEQILAETLIIASGASAKWLGLESEKALIGKGITSCATCDGFFYREKEVVVIGGGDTALEDALLLTNYASKITVIHRRDTLRASKYLQTKAFNHPKIHFIWNAVIESIENPLLETVTGVNYSNALTGEKGHCPCDGVFIAIGHSPNTHLFVDQLELNELGYIKTERFSTTTKIPGVFAAGDVVDFKYRQAVTAAGTGCMAGIDAYHFIQNHQ